MGVPEYRRTGRDPDNPVQMLYNNFRLFSFFLISIQLLMTFYLFLSGAQIAESYTSK